MPNQNTNDAPTTRSTTGKPGDNTPFAGLPIDHELRWFVINQQAQEQYEEAMQARAEDWGHMAGAIAPPSIRRIYRRLGSRRDAVAKLIAEVKAGNPPHLSFGEPDDLHVQRGLGFLLAYRRYAGEVYVVGILDDVPRPWEAGYEPPAAEAIAV